MTSYERQQQMTIPITKVYMDIEDEILMNIARKLKRDKSLLTDEGIQSWQSLKLGEIDSLTKENRKLIAKKAGITKKEVDKLLREAGYGALKRDEKELQKAAEKGKIAKAPPIEESDNIARVLASYQNQALDTFNLVNTTLLDQSEQAFLDIVNSTTGKVMAGITTPHKALRETASKWADYGVPALVDKGGKRWSTEAYVNMVMRSTSNNVANEMQDARMDDYGIDLIEISSHIGARPKCAPYQGKVFSRSGNSNKFPPFSTTSYGSPDGLFGVNCGHNKYPYVDGISKKTYEPYDKEENKRVYKESQKQRYLERRTRKAKREQNMLKAMGDEKGAEEARLKVRERQAATREFIDRTGRTRRYKREQIV